MMAQFSMAELCSDAKREEGTDDFRRRLLSVVANAHLSLAIALGHQLDMFGALAAAGNSTEPASAIDVARVGDLKARYVQEWLCCMASGDIIDCDPSGQLFWIPEDRVRILTGEDRQGAMNLLQNSLVPLFGGMLTQVAALYRKSGPLGIGPSQYKAVLASLDPFQQELYQKHLIADLLPKIGILQRLKIGIEVLDIGCGTGHQLIQLAEHFPRSKFTGVDICADAIRQAQQSKKAEAADRLDFIVADAGSLDAAWTGRFQLVLLFHACRDMARPDLAIAEAVRCLDQSGGQLAMVEANGTGNCHADWHLLGRDRATLLYAQSVLQSLPLGSAEEDGLQLGTMFGVQRGIQLLESAGLREVSVENLAPFMDGHVLYKARK